MAGFGPRFTISNAIAAGLTTIERARGFLEAATLSEAWVQRMGQRALLLEAHHTTHIEGTHLTLEQAERLSVARRTLQRDLSGLVGKRLVREVGRGPTDPNRHYLPGKL